MFSVGDKIIYNESGVCTVETIAPLDLSDGRLYYHLQPLVGSGKYFSPVDSGAFMRPVISQEEAEALIRDLLFRATLVKNPVYELNKPSGIPPAAEGV